MTPVTTGKEAVISFLHHRAMEVIIQGFDHLNQFLGFSIYLINDKP